MHCVKSSPEWQKIKPLYVGISEMKSENIKKTFGEDSIGFGASQVMLHNVILGSIALLTCWVVYFLSSENFTSRTLGTLLFLLYLYNLQLASRQLYTIIAMKLAKRSIKFRAEIGALTAAALVSFTIVVVSIMRFDIFSGDAQAKMLLIMFTLLSVGIVAKVSNLIPSLGHRLSIANQCPVPDHSLDVGRQYFSVPRNLLKRLDVLFFILPILIGALLICFY